MYPALREAARQAGAGPFTDWALLDPLRRVVRCRTLGALDTMTLLDQVDAWLAHAPLEHLRPPPPDQIDHELALLAFGAFADPGARHQVGARLAAAWPDAVAALRRHGYLPEGRP